MTMDVSWTVTVRPSTSERPPKRRRQYASLITALAVVPASSAAVNS
jgi:hypothetical protein